MVIINNNNKDAEIFLKGDYDVVLVSAGFIPKSTGDNFINKDYEYFVSEIMSWEDSSSITIEKGGEYSRVDFILNNSQNQIYDLEVTINNQTEKLRMRLVKPNATTYVQFIKIIESKELISELFKIINNSSNY